MQAPSTPASRLEIKIQRSAAGGPDGDMATVSLIGDAGVAEAGHVANSLLQLSASHPALVVFDLSRLQFISSLALGELVAFQKGVRRHGSTVRFVSPQPNVLLAIQRARLDSIFEIEP